MKRSDIIFILVATFILAAAWIIFNILHTLNTSTISDAVSQQVSPISSTFDTKTLNSLKQTIQITPAYTIATSPTPTPLPTPTPTPPLIVTITLAPTSSASASTGGALQ